MTISFSTVQSVKPWPVGLRPNLVTLHLQSRTSVFTSPFTPGFQTQEMPGQVFNLSLGLPPFQTAQAQQVRAFLASLRGQAGRFYFPVNWYGTAVPAPYQGEALNTIPITVDRTNLRADRTDVTVDADSFYYESIFTPNGGGTDPNELTGTLWINSGDCPLEVGSYLSFDDPTLPQVSGPHRSLHIVIEMVTTGITTTLTLEPPMLVQPTASTPIHIRNASGMFRLASDSEGVMTQRPGLVYETSFSATQHTPITFAI